MNTVSDRNFIYVPVTAENIVLATQIELTIFPGMCAYLSYAKALDTDGYFIVFKDGEAIGITGLYTDESLCEEGTVWLGWYGLLPPYRKQGLGRAILCDTIEHARKAGYETFRLYTSETLCPDACKLYDEVMDFGEAYTREETAFKRKVYSKALGGKAVVPWNNRPLHLDKAHEEETRALSLYQEHIKAQKHSHGG